MFFHKILLLIGLLFLSLVNCEASTQIADDELITLLKEAAESSSIQDKFEAEVWFGQFQLLDELLGHLVVIVLSAIDKNMWNGVLFQCPN